MGRPKGIKLSSSLAAELKDALSRHKVSQVDVGEKAGVAQATVSNWLGGHSVDAANASNIGQALGDVLQKQGELTSNETAMLVRLREELRGQSVDTANASNIGQVLGAEMREHGELTSDESAMLVRLREVGQETREVRRSPPGGVMPYDAPNHLPRKSLVDKLNKGLLEHPASIEITGGPMVGKSTLVSEAEAFARARGFAVISLDGNLFYDPRGSTAEQECAKLTRHFILQASTELGIGVDRPPNDLVELATWFKRERANKPVKSSALLVADGLALLAEETITRLHGLLRNLHNQRQQAQWSQLVVRSPISVSQSKFFIESSAMFSPHVDVGWFDLAEVRELASHYVEQSEQSEQVDRVAERAFAELGGQPLLTHQLLAHVETEGHIERALEAMRQDNACRSFVARVGKSTDSAQREKLLSGDPLSVELGRYFHDLGLARVDGGKFVAIEPLRNPKRLLHALLLAVDAEDPA